jgi:acetyltransferase-like isoleucine patch superfamily enzyme
MADELTPSAPPAYPLRRMIHEPTNFELKDDQYGMGLIIHRYCNIYGEKTKIGNNVKIGAYTEISNAVIGNDVVIGNGCFIPEGVTIEDGAWIGPRVVFTNDRFPPNDKMFWETTTVQAGARLGAGTRVLPGVIIGSGALIGAGSVVTKNIYPGEIWAGVPATFLRCQEDEKCISMKQLLSDAQTMGLTSSDTKKK